MKTLIAVRALSFCATLLAGSVAAAQDSKSTPPQPTPPPANVVLSPYQPDATGRSLPAGYASAEQLMAAQVPLTEAAQELSDVIEKYPGTGFGEIELDVPKGLVKVLWKEGRKIPPDVATLIGHIDARAQVAVAVETVPYSRDELRAEAQRILHQADATQGLVVARVEPLPGNQGLQVEVEGPVENAARMPLFKDASLKLELRPGKRPSPMFSRWDDSSPWYGGGGIRSGFNNGCSTGFGAWYDGWFSDDYYVLTAAHCAYYQNGVDFWDGNNDYMGKTPGTGSNGEDTFISAYDTIAIKVTNSGSSIFDGGVYVGEFTKPVHGAAGTWLGEYLCTSGAYSGVRCGIVVQSTSVYYTSFEGRKHGPHVRAEQLDQESAAGEGDSGGPVFSLSTNDGVIAKGTISAGDTYGRAAPCTGITSINGVARQCSWEILFPGIMTALSVHNLQIRSQ